MPKALDGAIVEAFQIKTTTMTPQQAQQRLKALDKERNELLKVIEAKPTPEQRFLELIQGLQVTLNHKYPDTISFQKNNLQFVDVELGAKLIWFEYSDFWSVFEKEFGFNDDKIKQLINDLLYKYFKLDGFTIRIFCV